MTSALEKLIIKKLFNFIFYTLFNTEETKTFIIDTYCMKMRITQPLGLG